VFGNALLAPFGWSYLSGYSEYISWPWLYAKSSITMLQDSAECPNSPHDAHGPGFISIATSFLLLLSYWTSLLGCSNFSLMLQNNLRNIKELIKKCMSFIMGVKQ